MEFDVLYWHWLVLGMLLMLVEIFLPSFTALWFGLGACLVGLLMLLVPGLSLSWQLLIWTICSVAFTFLWFRFFKPLSIDRTKAGLSREAILGEVGMVIALPQGGRRGRLRFPMPMLGSEEWDFICEEPLALGERVAVVDVSGNALLVRRHRL